MSERLSKIRLGSVPVTSRYLVKRELLRVTPTNIGTLVRCMALMFTSYCSHIYNIQSFTSCNKIGVNIIAYISNSYWGYFIFNGNMFLIMNYE